MTTNIPLRDLESLSAYLDGQLTPKERIRLEKNLQANADLRAILEDLRRTRSLLRNQPRLRAPRNFALTAEMVGARPRNRATFSLFPALRLTSALASFVFVMVVLGEFVFGGKPTAAPMIAAQAPAPAASETLSEPEALLQSSSDTAQEAAPAAKAGSEDSTEGQALSTEAVALLEATQEAPPDFPIDVPPETFSEAPLTPPQEGGGAGLGGGDNTIEEPLMEETVEGTPLPEAALSLSIVMTSTETMVAPDEEPLALSETQRQAYPVPAEQEVVSTPSGGWSAWRWLQAAFAVIALAAGLLAFSLRRTGRA